MIKLLIIHSLDFRLASLSPIHTLQNLAGLQVLKFQDPILEFSERPKESKRASDSLLLPRKSFPLSPSSLHSRTSPAAGRSTRDKCKSTQIPQQWTTRMPTLWNLFLLWLCFSPERARACMPWAQITEADLLWYSLKKKKWVMKPQSEVTQKTPLRKQPGIIRGQINYLKHGDLRCALSKRGRLLPVRKSWLKAEKWTK